MERSRLPASAEFTSSGRDGLAVNGSGALALSGVSVQGGQDELAVARFTRDGELDPAFGGTGIASTRVSPDDLIETATHVDLLGSGSVVATGQTQAPFTAAAAAVAFEGDGTLDETFGDGGMTITGTVGPDDQAFATLATTAAVASGSLYLAGSAQAGTRPCPAVTISKLEAGGAQVNGYGDAGTAASRVRCQPGSGAIAMGNEVLAAAGYPASSPPSGSQKPLAMLFRRDGTLDPGFGKQGVAYPIGRSRSGALMDVQRHGPNHFLLAGYRERRNCKTTRRRCLRAVVIRVDRRGAADEKYGVGGWVSLAGGSDR